MPWQPTTADEIAEARALRTAKVGTIVRGKEVTKRAADERKQMHNSRVMRVGFCWAAFAILLVASASLLFTAFAFGEHHGALFSARDEPFFVKETTSYHDEDLSRMSFNPQEAKPASSSPPPSTKPPSQQAENPMSKADAAAVLLRFSEAQKLHARLMKIRREIIHPVDDVLPGGADESFFDAFITDLLISRLDADDEEELLLNDEYYR